VSVIRPMALLVGVSVSALVVCSDPPAVPSESRSETAGRAEIQLESHAPCIALPELRGAAPTAGREVAPQGRRVLVTIREGAMRLAKCRSVTVGEDEVRSTNALIDAEGVVELPPAAPQAREYVYVRTEEGYLCGEITGRTKVVLEVASPFRIPLRDLTIRLPAEAADGTR
jgi:hypothetical protein